MYICDLFKESNTKSKFRERRNKIFSTLLFGVHEFSGDIIFPGKLRECGKIVVLVCKESEYDL